MYMKKWKKIIKTIVISSCVAGVLVSCSNESEEIKSTEKQQVLSNIISQEEEKEEEPVNMQTDTGYNQALVGADQVRTASDGSYNKIIKFDTTDGSSLSAMDAIIGSLVTLEPKHKNILMVDFQYYNNSNDSYSWSVPWSIQAFQNGIELQQSIEFSLYVDSSEIFTDVMPGATLSFALAYELRDANAPVIIQVKSNSNLFSNSNTMQVEYDVAKIRQYYSEQIDAAAKEAEESEKNSGALIQNEEQAFEYLKKYLEDNSVYIPGHIAFDGMIDQGYNFHGYDDMGDHISTSFWYAVSKDGRIYDGMMDAYVDEIESNESGEYILPYSDSKYYTYDEISQLSSEDLRIARNEIFARYGYIFSDEGLKEHFANCSWYVPTGMSSEEIESSLNDFEKQNLQLIKQCENE